MARRTAAVYRRRRLAVLLALILVVAVVAVGVWALIARPWEQKVQADPTPTVEQTTAPQSESPSPTTVESQTPSATETPGIVACEAQDIEVVAVTDAESYAPEQLPQLSISLTNKGATDCTIDVGTATQSYQVTSGDDLWWRSTDCQVESSSMIVTLTAGQTVPSATPLPWDRTRSSTTTCDDPNRERAPAGGSSYHVAVSIGGFDSASTRQIILQ
ncbi:hypothetical protein [Microbacterium sp. GXF0217]